MRTAQVSGLLCTALLAQRRFASAAMGDAARNRMMDDLTASACASGDASNKAIIVRGCDPEMAARAGKMLPPLLGNVKMIGVTSDDEFFKLLRETQFDVVTFAPGACRFSAARQPIPGGNPATAGWTLEEYRAKVKELQGADVPIVESTEERDMVPLLRNALGLPPA